MRRWIVLALAAAAAFAACHKSDGGGSTGSGDDDAGDDGSDCPCVVSGAASGTTVSIPCGQSLCVGGSTYWYCSVEGAPSSSFGCPPPVGDSGNGADTGCTPSCPDNACEIDDGCGEPCQCSVGLVCQSNVCGNGCAQTVGEYCGLAGDASTSCCQVGLACEASGDAGATTCCAVTGLGTCTQDRDCCDYPNVHCNLENAGDAGPDAARPSHTCIP